ncbi:sensor histidine kinase [Spongiactinospora rosea]|uniref:Sensor histidine kinase n=1 Tax=Spongiactinospora rosea TaxID=2248750 RepID=A0A366LIX1_9ACTN|nr:sensor histidine kinase [Spongiactinospora rosea]RBQ13821.1 sensor histidine kinase [Spongiactinospora rosea]
MNTVATNEAFEHPAFFYRTAEEYTEQTVSFVRDGLAAGEPVAVAVPGPNLELIKAGLGTDAEQVVFLDMTEAGRNPGRIIPRVLRAFADAHPHARVRIIGEPIWPGRTAVEYPACAQHEALINAAFAGRAATILCPYDQEGLDPDVLADAKVTHPILISQGRAHVSDVYDWEVVHARYNERLLPVPDAATFSFAAEELSAARAFAVEQARRLGLSGDRLGDVELAVAELTANSVIHGGGRGRLAIWADGGQIVCEVRDAGRMTDPLAGRLPADPHQIDGRGLMAVHTMADLVRVYTSADGTAVRFYLDL